MRPAACRLAAAPPPRCLPLALGMAAPLGACCLRPWGCTRRPSQTYPPASSLLPRRHDLIIDHFTDRGFNAMQFSYATNSFVQQARGGRFGGAAWAR